MRSKQVDVLVIGSGIGGMCAAAYLAHKGYEVLVTEALPRIGGHCSTFEYRRIKCKREINLPEDFLYSYLHQIISDPGNLRHIQKRLKTFNIVDHVTTCKKVQFDECANRE